MGESFLRGLRMRVFQHLMTLSMDFFETSKTGRLVARMTSDIDALSELLAQGLVLLVQNVLIFVGAVIAIFLLSWELALVVLVIVPPVYFASRWFRRVSNKAYPECVATASCINTEHAAGGASPRYRVSRPSDQTERTVGDFNRHEQRAVPHKRRRADASPRPTTDHPARPGPDACALIVGLGAYLRH